MIETFVADSFRKSFGRSSVLKAATVWAAPGRITVVMGRNGSGKTTLIRCALGMTSAEQGVVRFRGKSHLRPRLWRLAAEGLFFLPDRGLFSRRMTLGAQLALVASRFGAADLPEIAAKLEVTHLLDRLPADVSGGERRRAELAMAIVRDPHCLIADEPLAEVEPKGRLPVMAMLREIADGGAAVLVTGHEVHDLFEIADEVIWMVAGTTHGLGTPAEAKQHHQFRREYLGPGF